jgi:hypothetical protein
MSTAFTYGGIDRSQVSWAQHDKLTPDAAGLSNAKRSLRSRAAARRAEIMGFVYGGLDREPIEWIGISKPPKL